MTQEVIEQLEPKALLNVQKMLNRMIEFYSADQSWITVGNHNYLRITRILICLNALRMTAEAERFFVFVVGIFLENIDTIGFETLDFWIQAMKGK